MGKSVLRILVVVAALALGAAGVAAISLPWLVSTETVQSAIERELGNFFGTSAALGRQAELVIFPRPRAMLGDLTIAAPGGGDTPILTAESMEADIGLVGLLAGQPRFSSLRLVRPHMQLMQNEDGQIDWLASSGRIGRLISALNDDEAAGAAAAIGHRLGLLVSEGGRITFLDNQGEIIEDITSIDGQINWPSVISPVSVTADGIWRGTAGHLEFSTQAPVGFFGNQPAPSRIAVESEAASLTFDGTANLGAMFFADGAMTFTTPSMQALMAVTGTDFSPGRALGALELTGPMRIAQRRVQFEGLTISVDGNEGTGVLEIALPHADAEPALTGTLDFGSLDIYAFLSAFIDMSQLPAAGTASVDDIVSRIDTDLRISAADARFGDLQFSNLAATAQVSDDVAIFDIGDAEAYGGNVQARLALTSGEAGERAEVILSGQSVDSAAMDTMFVLPETLPRGRGNFSVTVNAPVAEWLSAARTAQGKVSIEMNDGVMPGVGVETLIAQRDVGRYFSLDPDGRAETFSTARIYGDIDDGLLTLRDTVISYPSGQVALTGIVSLATGSLALTAEAGRTQPDADATPAEPSALFFVGGSWNRPFATPVLTPPFEAD